MPISVQQTPGTRTFLECVQRSLRSIGELPPSTLVGPSQRVVLAMEAVEDARDEIFYHANWWFRRQFKIVNLVKGDPWYPFEDDFQDFLTRPTKANRFFQPLTFKTWEQVIELFPEMRTAPPGTLGNDLTTVSQLSGLTYLFGEPQIYTRVGDYMGLLPIPTTESIAESPNLVYSYLTHSTKLSSDEDNVGLPRNLWLAHSYLAKAKIKLATEFSDWQVDQALGREQLRLVTAMSGSIVQDDQTMGSLANYHE